MALRAGYYGLKNSVKRTLEKLASDIAGMKIIKSFGEGLNLTDAGKLNLTAATADKLGGVKVGSGLLIDEGVLSTSAESIDFSTTEQATGQKWIDGKDIYVKTWYIENGVDVPSASGTITVDDVSFIDTLIDSLFIRPASDSTVTTFMARGICGVTDGTHITPRVVTGLNGCKYIILWYTKKTEV